MISSGINLQQARLLSDAYEVGSPDFDDFSVKRAKILTNIQHYNQLSMMLF